MIETDASAALSDTGPGPQADDPASDDPASDNRALLDCAGEVAGEHAVILGCGVGGSGTLELMCALLRRGTTAVTELRRGERPEPQAAELAIIANTTSAEDAVAAVAHARRALGPAGRVVVRVAADASGRLVRQVARLLRQHGFSAIRLRHDGVRTLLTGQLPMFGPLPRF
jgi:hypothetical protein